MKKPEPKATAVVCTLCGLDWGKHEKAMKTKTAKPTAETCVSLLKAELARRPLRPFAQQLASSGLASYSGVPLLSNRIGKAQ